MKAKRQVVTGKATARSARGPEHRRGHPPTSPRAARVVERAATPRPAVGAPPLDGPIDLSVELGRGLTLPNPILVASGTFGYGIEYEIIEPVSLASRVCGRNPPDTARSA